MPLGDAAASWSHINWACAGDRRVRYRAAGTGPPVVLVHGLGASADYWARNGPPLATSGLRVLAPDLPGFGRTHGPDDGLTVPQQATALLSWADAMGIERAVYVGHSLGAQAVLELAARRPEIVRGLVLASPTGEPVRMARQAWRLFLDVWREPPSLISMIALAYLRAGPRRFWHTWRAAARHDPLPLLPHIPAPAQVILGENDPVVDLEFASSIARGLPSGRLVLIKGGAHAVHFDRAGAFNEAVTTFLRETTLDP